MVQTWDAPIRQELVQVDEEIRRSIRSEQPLLTEICEYVINSGGKRMRPGITLLSYKAHGGKDTGKAVKIAAAFEMIHSATLIHDDINDRSELRRGKPSAYKKYGLQQALIAGDYLFVKSFGIGGFFNEDIVSLVADACTAIAESEIVQIENEGTISEKDVYLNIIQGKTARPIMAGAKIGAYMAEADTRTIKDMGDYGLNIGMAFQIIDDILDIIGKEKDLGKPRMIDFSESKATIPLIYAMEDASYGERIRELFLRREKVHVDIDEAASLILRTDCIERSKIMAKDYMERGLKAIRNLPDSIYNDSLISLANVVIERSY